MLSDKMCEALNKQINAELASAYLYYSMSAYFESKNLKGMANWFRIQTQEEMVHSAKIYDYIHDRDGKVVLKSIEGPKVDWKSPLEAFQDAYEHEIEVSKSIYKLLDLSNEEKDHSTNNFLQWFISEQVEEEATTKELAEKLKLIGDSTQGLFMMDQDLAGRKFSSDAEG